MKLNIGTSIVNQGYSVVTKMRTKLKQKMFLTSFAHSFSSLSLFLTVNFALFALSFEYNLLSECVFVVPNFQVSNGVKKSHTYTYSAECAKKT